ncbi:DUF7455 domain-containing protein [Leucobacter ruminantium]|uniref:DUF7455 domain-containing protein n=1 Tax=Leucobacter ruminantium TaxID=1289170 RepID=A0A939RUV2_9MICO|nr:hypothetical protein [Leucobacter ruminantium]MBO1806210.1 hypothetical protein [Leucobacter ruminantium]
MTTLEHERTQGLETAEAANRPLSALDRCDSCGAQAYVRAVLSGSELLFCAHHAHKHEAKLRPMAEVWHDESHKLNA